MKKRWLVLFSLVFFLLIGGCDTNNKNGENENKGTTPEVKPVETKAARPGDYFPLKAGSTWTYQGAGNEYASFERQVEYVKNDFAQVREANGGTVSASVYQVTDRAVTRVYTRGESYDSKNILDGGFTSNDNTVIIQGPVKKGSSWQNEDNIKRSIISLQAKMDTPAGSFSCLHIRMDGPDYVIHEYYGKGVGLVRREFVSNGETVSSTLESYRIGPEITDK
ncbi:MAG: hypothetical protein GXY34_09590 [Syntrophomonadaceae bacterium]|nr:hypothetical protein [Syntrophomonadaceae bacterium]